MVVSRKAILSLLISVVLFAGFTVLAYGRLFDLVEARFYNPSVTGAIGRELAGDTKVIEQFLEELETRFAATLEDDAVRRSFSANQNGDDIRQRANLYGTLMESLVGLQSVRFIDAQGIRIHYSTWQPDILRRDRNSITYQNYTESPGYIPYWQVEVPERGNPHIVMDDIGERIIFSHPFYDSYGVYRGTALFSLSVRALTDTMAAEGRIKVGEDVSVISEPAGVVTGLPHAGESAVRSLVAQIWHDNILSLGRLHSGLTDSKLALMSMKTIQGIYVGHLVNESILGFPETLRIILLVSFLLTVYLILFLILNIRQDNMTIIQNRIKGLQINLIKEYYDTKGDVDWSRWKKELQQRRKELHAELKRGIKGDTAEIDALIDKSWDETLALIGGRGETGIDSEKPGELRIEEPEELEELKDPPADVPENREALPADEPEELEGLEEMEEPEELEELEEVEEIESLHPAPPKTRELDPLEAVESGEDSGRGSLASAIEFSPPPEELEKQKEAAAKSMVEKFEIQSPFSTIFSGLARGEPSVEYTRGEPQTEGLTVEDLEEEPVELLPLDEESPEPPTEAKQLKMYFVKPLLSVPFSTALNTEVEVLAVQDVDDTEENTVIAKRNGVPYINERILTPDKKTEKSLDRNFKQLVESVLAND